MITATALHQRIIATTGDHRRVGGSRRCRTPPQHHQAFVTTTVYSSRPLTIKGLRSPVIAAASSQLSSTVVTIQGRQGLDVTDAMKEFITDKVSHVLHNYEPILREVDVTVSVAGNHGKKSSEAHHNRSQKAEVTVYTKRHGVVRVEDTEDDLYAAVDLVMDKLKRKMVKMKEKSVQRNTWPGRGGTKGGLKIDQVLDDEQVGGDEDVVVAVKEEDVYSNSLGDIVREKLLVLEEAMSSEEAVEQLEAVGHDFFVFVDSKDGGLKVLYKREHHGYGLIIPTMQQ
jgi:putative sigma-54 modulation protein